MKNKPQNSLSKMNLFIEQYRQKGLLPAQENQAGKNEKLKGALESIDTTKLQKNADPKGANDWFDVWVNFWHNTPSVEEQEDAKEEEKPSFSI